jgi:hypothetical protein
MIEFPPPEFVPPRRDEDLGSERGSALSSQERDSRAVELTYEVKGKIDEILSLGPSKQVSVVLKHLAETACGALGTELYRSSGNSEIKPRLKPKGTQGLPHPPWQYGDMKDCLSTYEQNLKFHLTMYGDKFPKSGNGRKIDELYSEITRWIFIIKLIRENEKSKVFYVSKYSSKIVDACLKLPPLNEDSINAWADVIDMKAEFPESLLDWSDFERDVRNLKNRIIKAKKKIGNDPAGIAETKVKIWEADLVALRRDKSLYRSKARKYAIRNRLEPLIKSSAEKKAKNR